MRILSGAIATLFACNGRGSVPSVEKHSAPTFQSPIETHIAADRPAAVPSARPVDPASLQVLAAGLVAPDYATRLTATETFGLLPLELAVPALERQLGDPEEDVRAAAVVALGKHHDPRSSALLRSVRDDDEEHLLIRVLAASALVSPSTP